MKINDNSGETKEQKVIQDIYFYLNGSRIVMYAFNCLHTVNLSNNRLSALPEEFGNLTTLKWCDLSHNELNSLPDNLENLQSLEVLYLNNNKLITFSYTILRLSHLRELDLYENEIGVFYLFPQYLEALDVAQNYAEEPDDDLYLQKKNTLRLKLGLHRLDNAKSTWIEHDSSGDEDKEKNYDFYLEEEDWESDDYWDPSCKDPVWADATTIWNNFVAQKYKEFGYTKVPQFQNTSTSFHADLVLVPQPGQFDDP